MAADAHWLPLPAVERSAPTELRSWLAEPGLLTARVRAHCGSTMRFRMLGPLRSARVSDALADCLRVPDLDCLLREIEFCCGSRRVVYAQTVLPASTVARYPWLRDLGDAPLGESLRQADEPVSREPLQFAALPAAHELARAATDGAGDATAGTLWARRAVYRLGGCPILVQEVFLPALLDPPAAREGTNAEDA